MCIISSELLDLRLDMRGQAVVAASGNHSDLNAVADALNPPHEDTLRVSQIFSEGKLPAHKAKIHAQLKR